MSEKNFAFRVDASSQIGTGHFMRCLTLADALKHRGAQIRFVSRDLPIHLREMLTARGMELEILHGDATKSLKEDLAHSHWLGGSQAADAQATIQVLSGQSWDWLVVDHYALDARWETMLRQIAKKILVIDDIADRLHDCDVLLDQNLYADMEARYLGKVPSSCQLLLGPGYALLRDEFRIMHENVKPRSGPVKRILVFFGGVDADNYTGQAIEALSQIGVSDMHVDVVIGAQHPARKQIEAVCAEKNFKCHAQTNKMAELMANADLAIGAGGTATWERCCLGLPALVFCTANNQQRQIEDAARIGLLYSPEFASDLGLSIRKHAYALIENGYLRQFISKLSLQAVDGLGVSRVVANMECNDVEIRMVTLDDSESLFSWRNHPSIREVSRNSNVIAREDHQKWFSSMLTDSNRMLLIGHRSGIPVGVVRFDLHEDVVDVSIYLVPGGAFSGMGKCLLQRAEQWLSFNHPEINEIRAYVLGSNERSLRLFSRTGYQIESINYAKKLH